MLKIWLNLGLNLRSPGLLTSRITLQARARLKGAYLGSTIIHVNLHDPNKTLSTSFQPLTEKYNFPSVYTAGLRAPRWVPCALRK